MSHCIEKPRLSVVIPTYNRKDSLKVTLDALGRQDCASELFEVIVVSDGSTDGTTEFLTNYESAAPYCLRFIVQENAGPGRARNQGIEAAQGDVIVFVDDDIEPLPGFLTAHMAHHENDSETVVIGPMSGDPAQRSQEPCWIYWEHAMLKKQYHALTSGEWESAGPNHFYSGNSSLLRAHLLEVGGFDETFRRQEDVELAYRLQRERHVRFLFDPKTDALHRPVRSFQSWLNIAAAYGKLDVIRARRGDVSWKLIRLGYTSRNRATRLMASAIINAPGLSKPLHTALLAVAKSAYRAGVEKISTQALSALYNIQYIESACSEMGKLEMKDLIQNGRGE